MNGEEKNRKNIVKNHKKSKLFQKHLKQSGFVEIEGNEKKTRKTVVGLKEKIRNVITIIIKMEKLKKSQNLRRNKKTGDETE